MRMKGHAAHDDMRYVAPELVDEWTARDPLALYRRRLVQEESATLKELDDIDAMTKAFAESEAQLADEAPMPDPATVDARPLGGRSSFVPTEIELVPSPFASACRSGREQVTWQPSPTWKRFVRRWPKRWRATSACF